MSLEHDYDTDHEHIGCEVCGQPVPVECDGLCDLCALFMEEASVEVTA